ncbi:MAG TPA: hypothetical protein VFV23_13225 [Verrucomicrobiae bacterium]|nr:hypothetical protein [Verrucomicrobiae bacterium]
MLLPSMAAYLALMVAMIWLGVGSIMARRWARALLLIFAWVWLVIGIVTMAGMIIWLPKFFANIRDNMPPNQPPMPGGAEIFVIGFMILFLGFFFILLPAVWVFFYRSPHVKATCEARDPEARWTDACPLPVLVMPALTLFSLPLMVLIGLSGNCVMPFFGVFISGITAGAFCIAIGALSVYFSWLIYRLQPLGWWLALTAMVLFMISGWLTFARHDLAEMYQLMNFPPEQIELIQKTGMPDLIRWFMPLSAAPFVIYLLFIKRYFRKTAAQM